MSPWSEANLLNCGVTAFRVPVSNGDPWVISSVYNVTRRSTSLSDIPKNIQSLMYSLN